MEQAAQRLAGSPPLAAWPVLSGRLRMPSKAPVANDAQVLMTERYRSTGGLVSSEHLLCLMRRRLSQPLSRLARWIANRQLVQLPQDGAIWLPAFQFNSGFDSLRDGLPQVVAELSPVLDDLELANWFGTVNVSLAWRMPAELLATSPNEVLQVARLDRFVISGL